MRVKVYSIPSARRATLRLFGLALGVATSMKTMADEPPLPPPRPAEVRTPAPPEAGQAPVQAQIEGAASTCLAKLIASGAAAESTLAPVTSVEGCGIPTPVRLSSITGMRGEVVNLPDRPLLDCEFASVLADYVRLIVVPLGQPMVHAVVTGIETGPGYQCRTQDRIQGAKISAHAKGLAVDFVAIALSDKRRVLIERQAGPDEAAYFRAIRTAACGWFTTVLGPGADSFHANNVHLDIEPHGSSANYRICE
jgi:hypothetical protein